MNENNKNNNAPQNNNFFNKNLIFVFAISVIVMVIVFKSFFDGGTSSFSGNLSGSEAISYTHSLSPRDIPRVRS